MTASAGGVLRDRLKQVPGARSALYLAIALRQLAGDPWRRPDSFDRIFSTQTDPWESATESGQERFAVTLSVLASSSRSHFDRAAELGCAEGIFSERLAPLCGRLTLLDFSEVALDRARQRFSSARNVELRRWDMRSEPLRGSYNLVVAMDVITSLYRPRDVRRICLMIVGTIEPGGFLLFSDVRQSRVFEDAWWGRFILRGGEQIRRHLARMPELQVVAVADTPTHVFALFRRAGGRDA